MISFLLQLREAIRVFVNVDNALFDKANDAANKAASDILILMSLSFGRSQGKLARHDPTM